MLVNLLDHDFSINTGTAFPGSQLSASSCCNNWHGRLGDNGTPRAAQ